MASTTHSSSKSSWDKAKIGGKRFFDKVGQGVNKVSEKAGAEAFWPTSLDKESEKAAKILRSFCIDGFRPGKDHTTLEHIAPEVPAFPSLFLTIFRKLTRATNRFSATPAA